MKTIDLQAWVRWRAYHVTWAQLWNQEKREIMESRLVEQHRAFTPLPPSSFWRACVVSLPSVFFQSECFYPESCLNQRSYIYLQSPSTTSSVHALCSYLSLICSSMLSCLCTYALYLYFSIGPASPTSALLQLLKLKQKKHCNMNTKQLCIASSWMHNLKIQCWENKDCFALLYSL